MIEFSCIASICKILLTLSLNKCVISFCELYYPFRNPIVNPADILPVRGIPKLVIATEAAAAWTSPVLLLPLLIPGICIVRFESVVIAPSDTC
jgi:hypothetical protein